VKAGLVFALSLLGANLLLCDNLETYKKWTAVRPSIKISLLSQAPHPVQVRILPSAEGAVKMKISNFPDFRGSEWQKYSKEVKWQIVDTEDIISVYAVFKTARNEVSDVVNDSISRSVPYKKVELSEKVYIDWTAGSIYVTSGGSAGSSSSKYVMDAAQKQAEQKLAENAYSVIKNMSFDSSFMVKDFIARHDGLAAYINEYLNRIKITDIRYVSEKEIEMRGLLQFSGQGGLYDIYLSRIFFKERKTEKYFRTEFTSLVLDTRGLFYKPYLFPEISSADGNILFGVSDYERSRVAAHGLCIYIRSLPDIFFPDALPLGENPLFIKALSIAPAVKNRIVVSMRSAAFINANPQTVNNFLSGKIFIIVD